MLIRCYTTRSGKMWSKSTYGKYQAFPCENAFDLAKRHALLAGMDKVAYIPSWHSNELYFRAEKFLTEEQIATITLHDFSALDYICRNEFEKVFLNLHRTQQQSIVRNMVRLLNHHALRHPRKDYDLRNEASVKMAFDMHVNGHLDAPLPKI